MTLLNHLLGIFTESWNLFVSSAMYIVFGLMIAGLIHAFIRKDTIGRHLGGNRFSAVLKAALVGIPLPLCSCGVIPAAVGLRKEGASKSATVAFLISTPESGVDSIAVTYALIDPLMAVIRPIAAFITAMVAGIAEIIFGHNQSSVVSDQSPAACCQSPVANNRVITGDRKPETGDVFSRLIHGIHYAFTKLLADITPTFALGILLGGVIAFYLPESFVTSHLGTGWQPMLLMLVIGIPIYICAAASTPIAAALILKGMSPGVALVFLLAGPATNITSLPVIAKTLGWQSVARYLAAIAACALLLGVATNALYAGIGVDIQATVAHGHHPVSLTIRVTFAIVLLVSMITALMTEHRNHA